MGHLHFLKSLAAAKLRKASAAVSRRKPEVYELGKEIPIQTFYAGKLFDPFQVRIGLRPIAGIPPSGLPPHQADLSSLPLEHTSVSFSVDPNRSFFGDCLNVVDVPLESTLDSTLPPFGWSGAPLLGGYAMTASALSGKLALTFHDRRDGFIAFELDHGKGLDGTDSVLSAPDGYALRSVNNSVRSAEPVSRGQLEMASGRVHDFHYNVLFWNSAIQKLLSVNPALHPPPLLFPGLPHAGHAMAWVTVNPTTQRLEFSIAAEQFLPLGTGTAGSPLMFPGSESVDSRQESFAARNSSLHPFIFITAVGPDVPNFRPTSLPVIPSAMAPTRFLSREGVLPKAQNLRRLQGKTIRLFCLSSDTNFGDDFALRSDHLGGPAMAQSPLFGRLEMQFGSAVDGHLPFVLKFAAPSIAFHQKFNELMKLLPPGTTEGLVGMCGEMSFPNATFFQRELSLSTDPYKVSIGVVDLATATTTPFIIRKYLFQNVMKSLLMIEPRTPTDSFAYLSYAAFFETATGHIGLRLTGENYIPYPEGYGFPLPRGRATKIHKGSFLRPFVNLFAVEADAFTLARPTVRFVSTSHRRGACMAGLTLSVRSNGNNPTALELECGNRRILGDDCKCMFAVVGDAYIWILDFVAEGDRGRKTHCHCVLTKQQESAELQLISVDESMDCWVTGTCDVLHRELGAGVLQTKTAR